MGRRVGLNKGVVTYRVRTDVAMEGKASRDKSERAKGMTKNDDMCR